MATNIISQLNNNLKNAEFFVDCFTQDDLDRLKKETNIRNIYFRKENDIIANNIFTKIFKMLQIIKNDSKFYDLEIVLGGDDISEYYGKKQWLKNFIFMYIRHKKIPTYYIGQTIGPFTSYRKILARISLNQAKIYTRDDECYEYLKKIGIKTANIGRDLAFQELPIQEKSNEILKMYELIPDSYITIVPSGLYKSYTKNYDSYILEYCNIIEEILEKNGLKTKKIVILAHVKDRDVSDKLVIEEILKKIKSQYLKRIMVFKEDLLASEARAILGAGLFTITGRMHAAVSTFYMKKPALSLSYSVKYKGVIGYGLDMNDLITECAEEKIWENGIVSDLVIDKIDFILANYEKLIADINKNVETTKIIVAFQNELITNDIKTIK